MSKPLITISPNSSIKDAMQTMQSKNIRRLVVVVEKEGKANNDSNNNMVGIITVVEKYVLLTHQEYRN